MELERHGLCWSYAPAVLTHLLGPDDECAAVLYRDRERTAAGLDEHARGDGEAWLELCRQWDVVGAPVLRSLFTEFPPVRGPVQLLRRIGTAEALRLVRFLTLPTTRMGEELFRGEPARLLLAGNAMHADVPPTAPGSGAFGWILAMLGQQYGFPAPVGGAGELAAALARRATGAGAEILTGERVERIDVRAGRAVGVHTAGGLTVNVRRAVVADVSAPSLYGELLPTDALPPRLAADLAHFAWDTPVLKLNWALDRPIPWRTRAAVGAGTVHLGDEAGLVRWGRGPRDAHSSGLAVPAVGQMTTTDPSRSPAGTECAWAYTHLPRGVSGDAAADELTGRVDAVLEAHAPGFSDSIVARMVQRPGDMQSADANLVHGAVNGGTGQLFQQLVFRPPVPGLGRSETPGTGPLPGQCLGAPGGGVHGVCGWLAARRPGGAPRAWPRAAAGAVRGDRAGLPGTPLGQVDQPAERLVVARPHHEVPQRHREQPGGPRGDVLAHRDLAPAVRGRLEQHLRPRRSAIPGRGA